MSDFELDFQDTATAYADKSDSQLKEKYRLFKLLDSPFLNAIGSTATKLALSLGLPVEGFASGQVAMRCGLEARTL